MVRDLWVGFAMGGLTLLHIDYWAWERIHPLLWGWIPYGLWYDGLLTLSGAFFFLLWGWKGWPDPPNFPKG